MKDTEVVASAMFPFLLTERERLVASELSKRIVSLHAQLEAARKVVEAASEISLGAHPNMFIRLSKALAAYDAACGKEQP